MAIKPLTSAEIKGKKVLVRFDFNVPLDKKDSTKITDTTRIDAALPTLLKSKLPEPKFILIEFFICPLLL